MEQFTPIGQGAWVLFFDGVVERMLTRTCRIYGGLQCRRTIARGVYASNVVSDVGKYLSEAAAAIFSPIRSDVDFPTSDFSGR